MISEVNANPVASILITAFNRKDFLINSVRSALDQTIERDKYEIIVSKNFKDESIDKYLEDNGCVNILDPVQGIGNRLSELILMAKSNIVIFLEDDDLFDYTKVEDIVKMFEDSMVSYVNNSFIEIDINGNIISSKKKRKQMITINNHFELSNRLISLKEQREYFGMSNISIRKNEFIPYIYALKEISVSPDLFFFIILNLIDGKFIFSNKRLTKYRIHNSLSNIKGGKKQFLERRNAFWNHIKKDLNLYSNIISLKKVAQVGQLINIIELETRIHIFLTSDNKQLVLCLNDLTYCGKILVERKNPLYLKLFFIIALGCINKNIARSIYYISLK